jgi:transcriptional regulator of NAD metabolism
MTNISKSLRGGVEWRTPGKIKYQMHRSTYRKRENLIQNLNQRTLSIVEYQTGRTTYMMMKTVLKIYGKTNSCQ